VITAGHAIQRPFPPAGHPIPPQNAAMNRNGQSGTAGTGLRSWTC